MLSRFAACIFAFCLVALPLAPGEEQAKQKPIFPVALDHEFKDAGEAFEEVRALILEHYYSDTITDEALYWAAIKGMLRHVSPPEHPELGAIWTPARYEKVADSLKGERVSIGIKSSFNGVDGSLTVSEVIPGSPSEGIVMPYDRILRIDGQVLKGKPVKEIDHLLQGEVGTNVALTVVRDIKVFELTITREKFKTPNMVAAMLPENVAYVEIRRITDGVSKELGVELKELKEQGANKLIFDLRNNGGGVFAESMRIAELLLPEKHILLRTITRANNLQNYVSSTKEPCSFGSVAVLVNEGTASSCEIIAGAFRDHKVALIVGTHTYGKGVFEKTFTLKNDYRVKFIIGAMYTPRGQSWQTRGLLPDFAVKQDPKTLGALRKLEPKERLPKDVGLLTAYKLLVQKKE